jgi:cellulose synthase/poly-beta-1,6-N-acetylglucosamine synthase-like glycosyltransferase
MVAYAYDLEAFYFVTLTVLIFAAFSAWLYFLIYTITFFKRMPKLESANEQQQGNIHAAFISGHNRYPKVSVILPARNEEKYISNCLA